MTTDGPEDRKRRRIAERQERRRRGDWRTEDMTANARREDYLHTDLPTEKKPMTVDGPLIHKYDVKRVDGKAEKPGSQYFVLNYGTDPYARGGYGEGG